METAPGVIWSFHKSVKLRTRTGLSQYLFGKSKLLVILGDGVFGVCFPSLGTSRIRGVEGGGVICSGACLLTFLASANMGHQQELRRD